MLQQINTSGIKTFHNSAPAEEGGQSLTGFLDMELLRFSTAGSVDDGKSTLIGRLLYDSKSIFEDQLLAVQEASNRLGNEEINLALLTDGLRAEREQGITIDVAYRYFATPKRKFIIADTPGHIEYTRNMVTGASTADVAIILIDARNGIVEQTKRHSYIASLLQIPNVILAINKMDLVDFSEEVYNAIQQEFEGIAGKLKLKNIHFIPISAKNGDNVVDASLHTPWYTGKTILNLLESIPVHQIDNEIPPRFPVQYVIESQNEQYPNYKGFAGRISGGVFNVGDILLALPSNRLSTITAINEGPAELTEAFTPQSVTFKLDGNTDIKRGDMLVRLNKKYPKFSSTISLQVSWLNAKPLTVGAKYIIQHTTDETQATILDIRYKVNINTLENISEVHSVLMNDIALITIKTLKPLKYDDYCENRITGSLILIDENTFETVGAGMIVTDEEIFSFNI